MERDSAGGGASVMTSSEEQMTNGESKFSTVSGVSCLQVCRSTGDQWTEHGTAAVLMCTGEWSGDSVAHCITDDLNFCHTSR